MEPAVFARMLRLLVGSVLRSRVEPFVSGSYGAIGVSLSALISVRLVTAALPPVEDEELEDEELEDDELDDEEEDDEDDELELEELPEDSTEETIVGTCMM